jgi:hypothetical protein
MSAIFNFSFRLDRLFDMRAIYLQLFFVVLSFSAVLDRVAVVVGNNVITESEVGEELRLEQFLAGQPLDFSPQQRRAAADRLVDQQLIRQEMEVAHYQPPEPGKADAMLRNLRQQRFRSDAEYRAALQKYGITEDQLKRYLLWQLTAIQFTDQRFHTNIQQNAEQSANRAAPSPTPEPSANREAPVSPPSTQSADRLSPGDISVDQQLDAWLKQARGSTRVEFKKEAFQ